MERRKKLVWTLLAVFLVSIALTIALSGLGTGNPETVIYVDPPEVLDVAVGNSFDIYVTTSDVVDLFLAEICLSWDPAVLSTSDADVTTGDTAPYMEFMILKEVNVAEGWLHVVVGRPIGVKEGLSGNVQIAKITFLVEGEGSCALHFYDDPDIPGVEPRLKNSAGEDMDRTVEDGYFSNVGWIEGTVTDADTGLPIEGATVSANGYSDLTDSSGFYSIELPPGTYDVKAEMTGYESDYFADVSVAAGQTATLDFALSPVVEVGWIEGTVTDADTGLPIEGATVTADSYSTTTAADGTYSLTGLPPDGYTVEASAAGYESASTLATVVAGEPTTVDFALVPLPVVAPSIESSDAAGTKKDQFDPSDTVYVYGSQYDPDQEYDIYVVADTSWTDAMSIPARIAGTATTVTSDALGNIPATQVWSPPLTPGKYDIVVDVNGNGQYDIDIDALDDGDIEVTAGFFVIPEYALGTILGLIAFFAAFGVFLRAKRLK